MSTAPSSSTSSSVTETVSTTLSEKIIILDVDSVRNFSPTLIKVPVDIRKGHEDAYEPRRLFIGPYHRKPSPMEEVKLLFLMDLLSRGEVNLTKLIEKINEYEVRARMEYSELIKLSNKDFVEMLVIDGCFIIEFLLKQYEKPVQKWKAEERKQAEEMWKQQAAEKCKQQPEKVWKQVGIENWKQQAEDKGKELAEGKWKQQAEEKLKLAEQRTSLESVIKGHVIYDVKLPTDLRHDLLLLENQIPFFILEKIYEILEKSSSPTLPTDFNLRHQGQPHQGKTLIDLALSYLTSDSLTKDTLLGKIAKEKGQFSIYHLLHLSYHCLTFEGLSPQQQITASGFMAFLHLCRNFVHWCLIRSLYIIIDGLVRLFLWRKPIWSVPSELKSRMIPTATELKEAGVTFEKKNSNNYYLDVSFDSEGYFQIPFLSIQANTNSEFRNFLAFEQSCPEVGNTFTSYVVLMDSLIDTSLDVAVLKRKGVLESTLGSDDDVARLFNQMRSGLCFDFEKHFFDKIFQDVNHYCNREHNRWRAKLMHDYLGNPWAFISVIAAFTLLVLTTLQTIYSILSYKKG